MRKARTETYAHAITGLMTKREEMLEELAVLREREGALANDLEALDRVLERLGYDGPVKLTPRTPRVVLFYRGELRQFLLATLREHGPSTTREMAARLAQTEGKDARDRRMMADIVRRMGKSLRLMQKDKLVVGDKGGSKTRFVSEYLWRVASHAR